MTNDQFWRGTLGAIILVSMPYVVSISRSLRERWNSRRARKRSASAQELSERGRVLWPLRKDRLR